LDKKEIRRLLLEKRRSLSFYQKQQKEALIHQKVLEIAQNYTHIGIYVSLKDEVETHHLIEQLFQKNKCIYVPRCHEKTLTFHRINGFHDLKPSRYGLLEPDNEPVDLNQIEILFVPLVGFDSLNHRIGYGKGYYDSVLKKIKGPKIGLGFVEQRVHRLPVEEHDVALDWIIYQ